MASLDFHLVTSQLSVVEINVITILRLYYLQKGKQKFSPKQRVNIYELPLQKILYCLKMNSSFKLRSYQVIFTESLCA